MEGSHSWSSAHAWKACNPKGFASSNLAPSAMSKNIEVEVRSFINKKQYQDLLKFFRKNGKFLRKENQTTYYFSGKQDLRIQKTDKLAKLWLKGGKIHENYREDIFIECRKEDFEKLEKLLSKLGFKIKIKWFRKRNDFLWKGIKISVDFTKGYGYIIELEKFASEKDKKKIYQILIKKLKYLDIKLTSKAEFNKRFNYYKNNWRKLIK